jgi:hypothetical protein
MMLVKTCYINSKIKLLSLSLYAEEDKNEQSILFLFPGRYTFNVFHLSSFCRVTYISHDLAFSSSGKKGQEV